MNVPDEYGTTKESKWVLYKLIRDGELRFQVDDSVPSETMDGVDLDNECNRIPERETLLEVEQIKDGGKVPLSITTHVSTDSCEWLAIIKEDELKLFKHKSLNSTDVLER